MAFVIIGSGAAGISAAERLRELGKEVVLVSRDRRAYSLCSLPYMLSGEVPEERLFTHELETFVKLGIGPVLGKEVRRIDAGGKKVILDDGQEIAYEALLIATGSVPFVPPGLGAGIPQVRLFNSLEDARTLMEAAKGAGRAVVIGAGFSGLECAYALRKRGMDVIVVEMEDRVLPRIMDKDMSPPVEMVLKDRGVELFLRSKVAGIERADEGILVRIAGEDGEKKLLSDIAVLCLGVRPELSVAGPAGLKVQRGIVVGPDMQSSVTGIFAAGDVAEFDGYIPATWLTAAIQGAVAASNMAGGKARFSHLSQVNVATLFGVPVVGIGTPAAYLKGATESKLWKQGGVWRKLITADGKVAGYQSVGDKRGRGLVSLLSNELRPLQELFAKGGLHHPALSCAAALGLRQGRARASSRIRRIRGTRRA